jgi:CheY-like chemotaxis protein
MNTDPIIIIDDDEDDLAIINEAFVELKIDNQIITFNDGFKFMDYIKSTERKSFFILCDINMNKIGGLELKQRIFQDERLRLKCIPFLFFSTSKATSSITKAYSFGVQGYFVKPNTIQEYKDMFKSMISYWGYSQHPNS